MKIQIVVNFSKIPKPLNQILDKDQFFVSLNFSVFVHFQKNFDTKYQQISKIRIVNKMKRRYLLREISLEFLK